MDKALKRSFMFNFLDWVKNVYKRLLYIHDELY